MSIADFADFSDYQNNPGLQTRMTRDLDEKFDEARRARLPLEAQWLINLAFYIGKQWVQLDPVTRRLEMPAVPPWRVLIVVNHIMSAVRMEYAKLTRNRPRAIVEAEGAEPEKHQRAKASNKILDYLWKRSGKHVATKQALLWALVLGTGLIKVFWDPTAGDELPIGPDGKQPMADNGVPLHLGEIQAHAVSPFEVYIDPHGETMDDKYWLFHVKLRSAPYVKEKYGVDMVEEEVPGDEYLEGRLSTLLDQQISGHQKGILVKEYWERFSSKNPQGRYVVYARDRVLYAGPNPYPKWQIPFVSIIHIPVPGRFWGDCIVSQLIDAQRNYNKSRSQAVEIRNLMSKPKWLVQRGTIDRPITSAPGELIEYNGAVRPEPIAGKDVPVTLWKDLEQTMAEIASISGQRDVAHAGTAGTPAGAHTAMGIALMQEQDDTRLSPTSQFYEEAIEAMEIGTLHLARQFYIEPRTAKVVGRNSEVEVLEFSKDDIPEDVSLRVEAGSSLPSSPTAKRALILELWKEKVITDPRRVIELMEFGNEEGLYDDINLDIARAERENEIMKTGRAPGDPQSQTSGVEYFDNHQVHLHTHDAFRKTEDYEQLVPEIQQVFAQHDMAHIQVNLQIAEMQARMQLASSPRNLPDLRIYGSLPPDQEEVWGEQRGFVQPGQSQQPQQQPGANAPQTPGQLPGRADRLMQHPPVTSPQQQLHELGIGQPGTPR